MFPTPQIPPVQHSFLLTDTNTNRADAGPVDQLSTIPPNPSNPSYSDGVTQTTSTMNGWSNWETWNAALWIGNDEFLYNTAKACVTFREGLETPWDKFVRCMTDGQIGRHLISTPDGCRWDDPAIDADEMNEMLWEL